MTQRNICEAMIAAELARLRTLGYHLEVIRYGSDTPGLAPGIFTLKSIFSPNKNQESTRLEY